MSEYTVSVVIPVFNRKDLVSRALHSVLNQTLPVDEIIVVDDGSMDGAEQIIPKQFPTVRCVRQDHQGVSAARNLGVRMATGNWIAFLDSDDAWAKKKLARQIEALRLQPGHLLCHTNEIWIRNSVRVNPMKKHQKKGGWIFQHCLPRCAISPSAVLIKKALFDEVRGFDETLPVCEDYDLWLRICSRYPVLYLDDPLTIKYGGHEDQLSRRYWGMDRFRVRAIDGVLRAGLVKGDDEAAARRVLHQKCRILIAGAEKHQNARLKAACREILKRYPIPEDGTAGR